MARWLKYCSVFFCIAHFLWHQICLLFQMYYDLKKYHTKTWTTDYYYTYATRFVVCISILRRKEWLQIVYYVNFMLFWLFFFSCILFWMLRLLVTHWIKIFCGWPFWLGRVINLFDWIGWETGHFSSLKFLLYPKTGWVWLTSLCVDCFRPSAVTRMKQTKHTQESLLQKTCFRLVVSWKYWLSFFKEPFMFRQRSIFSSGFANEFRKSVPISNNCISNM